MQTQTEQSTVTAKTRELCQAILDQPEVQSMRQRIETFMADDKVRAQYDSLMLKGQMLQEKQHANLPLDGAEITAFETLRTDFLANPVGKGFVEAQDEMHQLQQSIVACVSKTFELGRVPDESELDSGSCGHGCGCHH
jgi:cell fate (sporulation/competence/biofilm development) regulator YlbF (YheA/YmcA/DUF963 family)